MTYLIILTCYGLSEIVVQPNKPLARLILLFVFACGFAAGAVYEAEMCQQYRSNYGLD